MLWLLYIYILFCIPSYIFLFITIFLYFSIFVPPIKLIKLSAFFLSPALMEALEYIPLSSIVVHYIFLNNFYFKIWKLIYTFVVLSGKYSALIFCYQNIHTHTYTHTLCYCWLVLVRGLCFQHIYQVVCLHICLAALCASNFLSHVSSS